jgi:hypothetical protein
MMFSTLAYEELLGLNLILMAKLMFSGDNPE